LRQEITGQPTQSDSRDMRSLPQRKDSEPRAVLFGTQWSWLALAAGIVLAAIIAFNLVPRSQRSGADPAASGRDNLVLQGRLYGMRGPDLHRRVIALLDQFQLADAGSRPVRTYSGGMQRRLDVALGLVHAPQVLFLDEPTAGLDPEARTAMWAEIARLAADEALAILLTTHYLEEADRLAGRLAIVDRGHIVAEGTPDGLKGELRGDAVHLEWHEAPAETCVRATLAGLSGLRDLVIDGARLSARADDGAAAVPVLLAALDQAGVPAASVTVARPSLDDVYLRYAGRRFAHAEATDGGAK